MKIRTRLTLLFIAITTGILLFFSSIIYYSAKENREKEFFSLLKKEGLTKADLYFDAKVDPSTLQQIYISNREIINEVEVAIYTKDFQLLYHDAVDIDIVKETPQMINEIIKNKEIKFYQNEWQVVGLIYEHDDETFIITSAAFDGYGFKKLNNLKKTTLIVFIISSFLLFIAGHYFSKKAFIPIKEMNEKAKQISATNLDLRLKTNDGKDELSELASTFNQMLDRLEKSFDSQKQFVSNISHELRTPLAAIISELELSLSKERNIEDYSKAIKNALEDAKKLARLSNSLLDLAKASFDTSEISFKKIRVDEVLLDARKQVQYYFPNYKINIHYDCDLEDEQNITVYGNEYLLKVAFINLFENGCKFSQDMQSKVSILNKNNSIMLIFTDKGIGISENDLTKIFTPFYRGENKNFAYGNGIGLSLTQKIIDIHKGTITVKSKLLEGTEFSIQIPHI